MATKHLGTQTETLALDLYIKLARSAETVSQRINGHLRGHQLTISQFGVLEALYHLGPQHQNKLASRILKSTGNMTLVVDNLVKRGLVERQRDTDDRRCVNVVLTEAGRTLITDIWPSHLEKVVGAVAVLSSQEQETLANLCKKLGLADAERD